LKLKNILKNLHRSINEKKSFNARELNKLIRILKSNSLHVNLRKGYSIIKKKNKIINKSKSINQNDKLTIHFSDKSLEIQVKKIN
jgi:exonuclease VII large subunit